MQRSGLLAIRCSATPGYRRICRTLLYFSFALQESFVSERCVFCIAGLFLIIVSLTQTGWFVALFISIIFLLFSLLVNRFGIYILHFIGDALFFIFCKSFMFINVPLWFK